MRRDIFEYNRPTSTCHVHGGGAENDLFGLDIFYMRASCWLFVY